MDDSLLYVRVFLYHFAILTFQGTSVSVCCSSASWVTGYCFKGEELLQSGVFSPFLVHNSHPSSSLPLLLSKITFPVLLLWLSCLDQSVTLMSMMEDLGISLQCYKGSRRRSRTHSGARSACVFCQPKRSSKREVARRDSSTWAALIRGERRKQTGLWSAINCWLKVCRSADWFWTCFLSPRCSISWPTILIVV